jgi:hypothetical protein
MGMPVESICWTVRSIDKNHCIGKISVSRWHRAMSRSLETIQHISQSESLQLSHQFRIGSMSESKVGDENTFFALDQGALNDGAGTDGTIFEEQNLHLIISCDDIGRIGGALEHARKGPFSCGTQWRQDNRCEPFLHIQFHGSVCQLHQLNCWVCLSTATNRSSFSSQ